MARVLENSRSIKLLASTLESRTLSKHRGQQSQTQTHLSKPTVVINPIRQPTIQTKRAVSNNDLNRLVLTSLRRIIPMAALVTKIPRPSVAHHLPEIKRKNWHLI